MKRLFMEFNRCTPLNHVKERKTCTTDSHVIVTFSLSSLVRLAKDIYFVRPSIECFGFSISMEHGEMASLLRMTLLSCNKNAFLSRDWKIDDRNQKQFMHVIRRRKVT